LAASAPRLKALVLMAGFPALSEKLLELVPLDGLSPADRNVQESYVKGIAPFDAERLIGKASAASILLQFARYDRHVSRQDARRFAEAIERSKKVRWYDGGHELSGRRAAADRKKFLEKHLRLGKSRKASN